MNISITKKELKHAVTGLSKIVPRKSTLPILGYVRLDAKDGSVIARATNLDETVTYTFEDAKVEGNGSFVVELARLKDLAKGSAKESVTLERNDNRLTAINSVAGSEVRVNIPLGDIEEWPEENTTVDTTPAPGLLDIYRRTVTFASDDETRHVLQGVCIESKGKPGSGCIVATDGRRLTAVNSQSFPFEGTHILRTSKFLSWTALKGETRLGVCTGKDHSTLGIQAGNWMYTTKAIEGTFPDWRQVVPDKNGHQHKVTFTERALDVVRQLIDTLPGEDVVTLRMDEEGVSLGSRGEGDSEVTWAKVSDCEHSPTKGHIAVDRTFFRQMLDAGFKSFTFNDELSPLHSDDGQGGLHVLMPMRVDHVRDSDVAQDEPASTEQEQQPDSTESANDKEETKVATNTEKIQSEHSQIELALQAVDAVKAQVQTVSGSLKELTSALKQALRDNKSQRKEMDQARAALAKLQAISL